MPSPPSSLDNNIRLTDPIILTIIPAAVKIKAPRKNVSLLKRVSPLLEVSVSSKDAIIKHVIL